MAMHILQGQLWWNVQLLMVEGKAGALKGQLALCA